jgi:antirestriction protein ArdC
LGVHRGNAVSKKAYRGINVLVLWAIAQEKGYTSGIWGTYKQWQELGAQVRKGEKSANVVFWKFFDGEEESEATEKAARRLPRSSNTRPTFLKDIQMKKILRGT